MASPKQKGSPRRKPIPELDVVVSSLRKENSYLKMTLAELSRQHSEHNKLLERFLSLETFRLESSHQLTDKQENIALPSKQLRQKEGNLMDVDSASSEWDSTITTAELPKQLSDALEKNKQWLAYDQQREAYVREIMARMLWLEKQLNEANQSRSQRHNEEHSEENEEILTQMQQHYERLLQKATEELDVLREQVNMIHQTLIITRNHCQEREHEVEELKQQLQNEITSRKSPQEPLECSEDEDQWITAETQDLQCRLNEEKRKSARIVLQSTVMQKAFLNSHHADQETIEDLERQIKISSQDLDDEKQNCAYLKKQTGGVLKRLQTNKEQRDQPDQTSCEAVHPPSTCSSYGSLLNESFLACPGCRAEYPSSQYRELMVHLESCLD
ncbi:centrosomal protein of 55 kDa-like [Notothenia coriiceps]|uniref:Centrosomal protein of 55 kDa-like n=1 Tax=Notothenia coriiceps TaxID=8208 RepID=A0A6I9PUA2_9TELE|nr:PREDICTED: centrosomal protein of 55 kDa-like [Notothenia coriiceps]